MLFTKVHEPAAASANLGVLVNLRVGKKFILSCSCLSIYESLYFISRLTGYHFKNYTSAGSQVRPSWGHFAGLPHLFEETI